MDINQFQETLREEIAKNKVSERTESVCLLQWLLENIFHLDTDFSKSIICDNNKDKGIDGIYVDPLEEIIYVFQSKYKENNNRHIGDKVLRDFSGVKQWFKDADTIESLKESTINKELKKIIDDYNLIDIISEYSIEYHFVSNAFKNDDTEEYLKVNNDIMVWDIETLMKHYFLIKDDPLVEDKHYFNGIKEDKIINYKLDSNLETLIVPIEATELLKLKGIQDLTLFSKNVRYSLGNTRVNKAIRDTLKNKEEKKNFLIFHNGISMVCEKFGYNKSKEKLYVENYSVVNGAQSILSFAKNNEILDKSIVVLLKITEVGNNPDMINLISKYNNNQNSISMKDLRSNDKIQKRIAREFELLNKKYDIGIVYSPKRGAYVPAGHAEITSDYAGQLIESCYLKRSYNTHLKASIFDTNYNDVFNKNINAVKILMYYKAHNVLKEIIDIIEDDGIADYGLAQHFLIMTLFDIITCDKSIKSFIFNEENYIENIEEFDKIFEKLLSIIIKVFNKEIRQQKKNEDFVYKNFFKSKEKVSNMFENVKGMVDALLELENTDLKKLFDECAISIE